MRKIILNVAVSLDGYIEGPNGEYDWCFTDQDYGMTEFVQQIDTIFYGRKSYDLTLTMEQDYFPNQKKYVFSNTLQDNPKGAILIKGDLKSAVKDLKKEAGKDIWLFGGASLVETFLKEQLIDEIWLALHPLALGAGKPLFQNIEKRLHLELLRSKTYSSGLIQLFYKRARE